MGDPTLGDSERPSQLESLTNASVKSKPNLNQSLSTGNSDVNNLQNEDSHSLNLGRRKGSSSNLLLQNVKNVSLHSLRTQSSVDSLMGAVHTPPVQRIKNHNEMKNPQQTKPNLLRRGSNAEFVGLYDFEKTLGKGHFAVVKLARHVFTSERVAVKVGGVF